MKKAIGKFLDISVMTAAFLILFFSILIWNRYIVLRKEGTGLVSYRACQYFSNPSGNTCLSDLKKQYSLWFNTGLAMTIVSIGIPVIYSLVKGKYFSKG